MTELITARCSAGKIIVTESHVILHLATVGERSLARSAITSVSIGLSIWYGFGFLRKMAFYVQGEVRPVRVTGMRKSKALRVKALLGF